MSIVQAILLGSCIGLVKQTCRLSGYGRCKDRWSAAGLRESSLGTH